MPRVTLRPQMLRSLKPGPDGRRISYMDSEARGLGLRVGEDSRTWVFSYCLRGEPHVMRLGDLDERVRDEETGKERPIGLSERRDEARRLRALVSQGLDPLAERKADRRGPETFAALARRAIAALAKTWRPKTTAEAERLLEKELDPAMGDVDPRDPAAVKRAALVMGDRIKERAPYVANRAHELARRIMSWAAESDRSGDFPANPLLRIKRPLKEEASRSRLYSDDEVRRIVAGSAGTRYEDVVALLLATGARADEVLGASWPEFDIASRTWTIPGSRSKIKVDRPVHLNGPALAVLDRVKEKSEPGGFLFPAGSASGRMERRQKVAYSVRAKSGVADFELHDLRRVVRAGLGAVRTPTDVGELCLGHLPPKLVRRYMPHPTFWRLEEQRAAVEAWGARLGQILSGERKRGEVVPITRRG